MAILEPADGVADRRLGQAQLVRRQCQAAGSVNFAQDREGLGIKHTYDSLSWLPDIIQFHLLDNS